MESKHPLLKWLETEKVSRSKLAADAGISQPMLSCYLNGKKRFGVEVARRIAALTGLTADDLLFKAPITLARQALPARGNGR